MPENINNDIDPYNIEKHIAQLNGWEYSKSPDRLKKSYKFEDFKQCFQFITSCAAYAEKIGHHPEWTNVYSKLDITLTTHETKTVTNLDILTAEYMDTLFDAI